MVKLLQLPLGAGCERKRKMLCIFLWLTFTGIFRDTLSAPTIDENRGVSQRISNYSSDGIVKNMNPGNKVTKSSPFYTNSEFDRKARSLPSVSDLPKSSVGSLFENDKHLGSIQKSPTKSNTVFLIPYLRPGRSGAINEGRKGHAAISSNQNSNINDEKRNTVIPMPRYGRSQDNLIYGSVSKKHDTIIPGIRFGRGSNKIQESVPYNVIPYPRLGRSLLSNDKTYSDVFESKMDEINLNDVHKSFESEDESREDFDPNNVQKRDLEDYDTVIPYPRPGRNSFEEDEDITFHGTKTKRLDSDYLLPQLRYGRSVILISSPKMDSKSSKEKPHSFVLPYPRPGRSNKQGSADKNLQVILPYPRPGRSENENNMGNEIYLNDKKKRQGYMLPTARFGRSDLSVLFDGENIMNIDQEAFLGLKVNPLVLKPDQKSSSEKSQDLDDSNAVFIIPYPRPGKKSSYKTQSSNKNTKSNKLGDKNLSDYVLPYPRPGKKSIDESRNFKNKDKENEKSSTQNFILPYPRPGRSDFDTVEKESISEDYQMLNGDTDDIGVLKEISDIEENLLEADEKSTSKNEDTDYNSYNSGIDFYDFNDYNSSHRRIKRSSTVVPYPRLGRSGSVIPYPRLGRSTSVVPYPRPGRSNSVIPYPRLGRSNSVIPYPRLGRSDSVVPYPRPGRSDSVIPYPRFGRSNSVIPYPRLGRSNSVIPYPRLGRSNSVVPYPRLGRSDTVVPYPRPGRSNSVVPYPRPGRSDSVIPYPRLGRSNSVIPYPRLGRSNSVVPYPRLGRSDSIVPYPRPGRSDTVVPYPRPGRSDSVVPYPRPGRSDSVVPYPRPGRSNFVVPYPRPGRSDFLAPYLRLRKSDTVVPYPRPGRSLARESYTPTELNSNAVDKPLPIIKPDRLNSKGYETYILPYPRPGRSENGNAMLNYSLYSHLVTKKGSGKNIIPYPRFGRTKKYNQGYILPQYRFGRSEENSRNENETTHSETVIPYPRLGRSQKQVTPSPDASNSVHKMNKHMLTSAEDSIYLLPYPRPGRYSQ